MYIFEMQAKNIYIIIYEHPIGMVKGNLSVCCAFFYWLSVMQI